MKTLKWINTAAFAAMILINILANLIPFGGMTTGDVSKAYPTLFTPAPITFAIWGVIYFFMAAFVLFQWGVWDRGGESNRLRERIGLWFAVSCLWNIGWIFAWHFGAIGLSLLFMIGLFLSITVIVNRVEKKYLPFFGRTAAGAGFELYYGWIIAAAIANISVLLKYLEWDGWGLSEGFWTVTMIILGAVIASLAVLFDKRWFSAFAVIWAYVGILIRHIAPSGYGGTYASVIAAAIIAITGILTVVILRAYARRDRARERFYYKPMRTVKEKEARSHV